MTLSTGKQRRHITAKLFNTILTNRLDVFLKDNALINPVQVGFTKKARTADHMFVLRTLCRDARVISRGPSDP